MPPLAASGPQSNQDTQMTALQRIRRIPWKYPTICLTGLGLFLVLAAATSTGVILLARTAASTARDNMQAEALELTKLLRSELESMLLPVTLIEAIVLNQPLILSAPRYLNKSFVQIREGSEDSQFQQQQPRAYGEVHFSDISLPQNISDGFNQICEEVLGSGRSLADFFVFQLEPLGIIAAEHWIADPGAWGGSAMGLEIINLHDFTNRALTSASQNLVALTSKVPLINGETAYIIRNPVFVDEGLGAEDLEDGEGLGVRTEDLVGVETQVLKGKRLWGYIAGLLDVEANLDKQGLMSRMRRDSAFKLQRNLGPGLAATGFWATSANHTQVLAESFPDGIFQESAAVSVEFEFLREVWRMDIYPLEGYNPNWVVSLLVVVNLSSLFMGLMYIMGGISVVRKESFRKQIRTRLLATQILARHPDFKIQEIMKLQQELPRGLENDFCVVGQLSGSEIQSDPSLITKNIFLVLRVRGEKLVPDTTQVMMVLRRSKNGKVAFGTAECTRLSLEAYLLAQIRSPFVARLNNHKPSIDRTSYFFCMQHLEGRSLWEILRQETRLEEQEVCTVAENVLSGLGDLHKKGIHHKQIQPSAIMRCPEGKGQGFKYVIIELGAAVESGLYKVTPARQREGPHRWKKDRLRQSSWAASNTVNTQRLLFPESYVNLNVYSSPELILAAGKAKLVDLSTAGCIDSIIKSIDQRTDLWSLGATLMHLAAGQPPFGDSHGQDISEILEEIADLKRPAPSLDDRLPDPAARMNYGSDLESIMDKCLRKEREDRYSSTEEALADLLRIQVARKQKVFTVYLSFRPDSAEDAKLAGLFHEELNNTTTPAGRHRVSCFLRSQSASSENANNEFLGFACSMIHCPLVSLAFTSPLAGDQVEPGADLSPFGLERLTGDDQREDAMLTEILSAHILLKHQPDSSTLKKILPILVGRMDSSNGMSDYFSDGSNGGGGQFPDKVSEPSANRAKKFLLEHFGIDVGEADQGWTVKNTMVSLLKLQGVRMWAFDSARQPSSDETHLPGGEQCSDYHPRMREYVQFAVRRICAVVDDIISNAASNPPGKQGSMRLGTSDELLECQSPKMNNLGSEPSFSRTSSVTVEPTTRKRKVTAYRASLGAIFDDANAPDMSPLLSPVSDQVKLSSSSERNLQQNFLATAKLSLGAGTAFGSSAPLSPSLFDDLPSNAALQGLSVKNMQASLELGDTKFNHHRLVDLRGEPGQMAAHEDSLADDNSFHSDLRHSQSYQPVPEEGGIQIVSCSGLDLETRLVEALDSGSGQEASAHNDSTKKWRGSIWKESSGRSWTTLSASQSSLVNGAWQALWGNSGLQRTNSAYSFSPSMGSTKLPSLPAEKWQLWAASTLHVLGFLLLFIALAAVSIGVISAKASSDAEGYKANVKRRAVDLGLTLVQSVETAMMPNLVIQAVLPHIPSILQLYTLVEQAPYQEENPYFRALPAFPNETVIGFQELTRQILLERDTIQGLMSVLLEPIGVVSLAWPPSIWVNPSAFGLDLLAHPERVDHYSEFFRKGSDVLFGPARLIENRNREALLAATPIYIGRESPNIGQEVTMSTSGEHRIWWGYVESIMDLNVLMKESGIDNPNSDALLFDLTRQVQQDSDGAQISTTVRVASSAGVPFIEDGVSTDFEILSESWTLTLKPPDGFRPAWFAMAVGVAVAASALLTGMGFRVYLSHMQGEMLRKEQEHLQILEKLQTLIPTVQIADLKPIQNEMPAVLRNEYCAIDAVPGKGLSKAYTVVRVINGSIQKPLCRYKLVVSSLPARASKASRDHLRQELHAIQSIHSAHLVALYDYHLGLDRRSLWQLMEEVGGERLSEILERNIFCEADTQIAAGHILLGLQALHWAHIMHGNLESSKVVRRRDPQSQRVQFVIAELGREEGTTDPTGDLSKVDAWMYSSPEQLRYLIGEGSTGDIPGQQADIWSVGCLLYHMITGKLPFHGPGEVLAEGDARSVIVDLPWQTRAVFGVQQACDTAEIISMCLQKSLWARYKRVEDVLGALVTKPAIQDFHLFISYRVVTEALLAQMFFENLNNCFTPNGHRVAVYLDSCRLKDGEDWELGFSNGLCNSKIIMPLVSWGFTAPLAGAAADEPFEAMTSRLRLTGSIHDPPDHVLKEAQMAISLMEHGSIRKILPVFVGNVSDSGKMSSFSVDGSCGGGGQFPRKVSRNTTDSVVHFLAQHYDLESDINDEKWQIKSTIDTVLKMPGIDLSEEGDRPEDLAIAEKELLKYLKRPTNKFLRSSPFVLDHVCASNVGAAARNRLWAGVCASKAKILQAVDEVMASQ